jgi:uncharacterized protein (DUF302 family)
MPKGFESVKSTHPVDETVRRVQSLLVERGIKLFALIDHAGQAIAAGLQLHATKLLIFDDPKAGTLLMQTQQTVGIDLPLKALVWEDEQGNVWIGWSTIEYVLQRHAIEAEKAGAIGGFVQLLRKAGA